MVYLLLHIDHNLPGEKEENVRGQQAGVSDFKRTKQLAIGTLYQHFGIYHKARKGDIVS